MLPGFAANRPAWRTPFAPSFPRPRLGSLHRLVRVRPLAVRPVRIRLEPLAIGRPDRPPPSTERKYRSLRRSAADDRVSGPRPVAPNPTRPSLAPGPPVKVGLWATKPSVRRCRSIANPTHRLGPLGH